MSSRIWEETACLFIAILMSNVLEARRYQGLFMLSRGPAVPLALSSLPDGLNVQTHLAFNLRIYHGNYS